MNLLQQDSMWFLADMMTQAQERFQTVDLVYWAVTAVELHILSLK